LILLTFNAEAQISPGDLAKAHAQLEGISNCTKCHAIGNKVTREKCLDCHKDIQANIIANKGYHASKEVAGKRCVVCHNDHHGLDFQLIKLDKKAFNHNLTGFVLRGKHAQTDCNDCHKAAFIKNPNLKKKASTFLGLKQECLLCHADYHQGKLSSTCTNCHNFDSWKKAPGFDHSKTRFPLLGEHKNVECIKCHKTELVNGKTVQKFSSLQFTNCTPCHEDVHKNKFGQNCKQCHTEESFAFNKSMKAFDHNKTNFKLIGKHLLVDCKKCHTGKSLTTPIKHQNCTDCHADYHKAEFAHKGISPDCNECHTNSGFTPSTFTVEKHNATKFKLEGAHLATACAACHHKQKDWTFKNMGRKCVDCHNNVHKGLMDEKFMPNEDCSVCHNITNWKKVTFDHNKTGFKLEGSHTTTDCADCHYRKNEKGIVKQQFAGLSKECGACHKDSHANQFAVNGKTDCTRCHGVDKWENSKYDHNTSRFKIDGAHRTVKCDECHKPVSNEKGKYIEYKFKSIECSTCHS